ncbi:acyl-CoA carboxylase subunit beta [Arthrobacter sp. 2MCAF15]|uniref:acyl-CoA carboxylase subunit beta n=1 Tax=Arthrobacter sp. 2MCAF15 TaxID=3232984 RepID=UPI003F8F10CF
MSTRDPLWKDLLDELGTRRATALNGGGVARIEREHAAGRLSARERIDELIDEGTFLEFGTFVLTPSASGPDLPSTMVCGLAEIDGRPVAVGAEDFTVEGGGVGVHLAKYKGSWGGFIEELAHGYKIPLVLLLHGVGGSVNIQEVKGYPELVAGKSAFPIFDLLGKVPVITAVLGPAAGSSAARAVISHFSVMTKDSGCLFAGGPPLVKQALGMSIDKLELGGAEVHAKTSGLISNVSVDDADALMQIRTLLSYLPLNVWELPERADTEENKAPDPEQLLEIVSPNGRRAYNVHALVAALVDRGSFFETVPDFGKSVRTGFARIDGYVVGVLATDARVMAGAMTVDSAEKQTRFVEMCDIFHIPIIYLVDVPGFNIGLEAEKSGVLRAGARAVQAIQEVEVPVYTVQVRRSFGLAAQATGSSNTRSVRLAWPSGSWGDLPLHGGIEAAHRTEIESSDDPTATRADIVARYGSQSSPWRTVERFGLEEMIDPRETRRYLKRLLRVAYRTSIPHEKARRKWSVL